MSRTLAFLPLVVLAALAALFGLYALHHDPQVQPKALVGRPMPDLTLPSLADGQPVGLRATAAAEGPILVNFFASWCAPCELEHPMLLSLKGRQVRIVGVAYKDAPDKTRAFIGRLGDPYADVLVDRDGRAGVEFGTTGVPETYLVGRDGRVIAKHSGPLGDADARDLLERALMEAAGQPR